MDMAGSRRLSRLQDEEVASSVCSLQESVVEDKSSSLSNHVNGSNQDLGVGVGAVVPSASKGITPTSDHGSSSEVRWRFIDRRLGHYRRRVRCDATPCLHVKRSVVHFSSL